MKYKHMLKAALQDGDSDSEVCTVRVYLCIVWIHSVCVCIQVGVLEYSVCILLLPYIHMFPPPLSPPLLPGDYEGKKEAVRLSHAQQHQGC